MGSMKHGLDEARTRLREPADVLHLSGFGWGLLRNALHGLTVNVPEPLIVRESQAGFADFESLFEEPGQRLIQKNAVQVVVELAGAIAYGPNVKGKAGRKVHFTLVPAQLDLSGVLRTGIALARI